MTVDWIELIKIKVEQKRQLGELYTIEPFPPRPAADEDHLRRIEMLYGHELDPQYKDFLREANGWKNFLFRATLFGTEELLPDSELRNIFLKIILAYCPENMLPDIQARVSDFLIIGGSQADLDVFLLGIPNTQNVGRIVRVQGSGTAVFPSFIDFYRMSLKRDEELIKRLLTRH